LFSGANSFDARKSNLTEMCWSRLYLSVEKVFHAHSNTHNPPKKKAMMSGPDNNKCMYAS